MGSILTESFIKTIRKKVDDCSNPVQLREYLNRYRSYVFTSQIQEVFLSRLEFFKEYYRDDPFISNQCEELEDELTTEIQISQICGQASLVNPHRNHPKIERAYNSNIDLNFLDLECYDFNCPFEEALLKDIFNMTNGNKMDICRILNVTNEELNKKIFQYKLKPELNGIRREYRSNGNTRG